MLGHGGEQGPTIAQAKRGGEGSGRAKGGGGLRERRSWATQAGRGQASSQEWRRVFAMHWGARGRTGA